MTDAPKLKPCPNPWCGSQRPPFLVWDLFRRHVQCGCGVKGPSSGSRSLDGVPHDVLEAEAIAAWNIRAALEQNTQAAIEARVKHSRGINPRVAELMVRIQTGEKDE